MPESFQVAIGMQQRGLHDDAARHFRDFLKQNGRHRLAAEAHYRLGVSEAELARAPAAIAALQQALASGGDGFKLRPECRYRLGNLLQAAANHQGAAEQFDALGGELPADHYLRAAAAFAAGECHRELGDDAAAADGFATAAKAASGDQAAFRFPALYQLGFCLLRSTQLAAAEEVFGLAEAAAPDAAARSECRYLRGDTLLRFEQFDAAERAFTGALEARSEFGDDAAFGLGWVALGRGDQAAARAAFARVIRDFAASPLAPKARLELGRSLYRDKEYVEADRALAPLAGDAVPADIQQAARELRGLCALASGAGEDAVRSLRRSLGEAAPADQPRLSFALAEALANLTRWQEALTAYDAVPSAAGAALHGDALYGACFALHQLGRYAESNAKARVVLALEPAHRLRDDAAFAIAENQFLSRAYAEADAAYAALERNERFAGKAAWKRAWCHYLNGDKKGAADRFSAVAKTAASFAEEALSMEALSRLECGDADTALAVADRYRARHRDGAFLDRTERIAARVLRQRGDLGAAQKRLRNAAAAAAARNEDTSGDRIEQAELAYGQGDYRVADGLFATLTDHESVLGARARAGRAWCAFELGSDDTCQQWLQLGLSHPAVGDEAAGLIELQSALSHRAQDWPAAIAAAEAFLQRYGEHSKAPAMRYALGVAQARAGDHGAGRATLAQLERDGGYDRMDRVVYELAWACRRDGDEEAALAAFGRCVAATQDAELAGESRLHVGDAQLATDGLEAARPVLLAVEGSHRGRALYRLGFAEFEAAGDDGQQLGVARGRFDAIAAIDGEELAAEALFFGAECSQRLGDHQGAVQRLGRLFDEAPGHARCDRARLVLGESAVQLGYGDLAAPALEQFVRKPDRPAAEAARGWLALGRARFLRGEHGRAEQAYQRVTELSEGPLGAEAQFRIGESRRQDGDLQGAADAFVKLPILYAHAEWVRQGLLQAGLCYRELRQPEKAKRFFTELRDNHPDSEEATLANKHLRDG